MKGFSPVSLETTAVEPSKKEKTQKKSALRENVEAILLAVVLALFIRTFVVQAFKIPSGSMLETLQIGDHILVNKFSYGIRLPFSHIMLARFGFPDRGDIVVFEFPEDPDKDFIKRVIGLPGDVVEIKDKHLYVNGKPAEYAQAEYKDSVVIPAHIQPRDNMSPLTVPQDKIFVMGDNRDHSYDSRFWGCVDFTALRGKAFMIYWSWDHQASWVRWRRIGNILE